MKKRILSILLAALMIISVLPVTAMAADGTTDTPVTMTRGNTDGPKLQKTAQWVNKNAGIAKITMEVWGDKSQTKPQLEQTRIVLVIDRSYGMNEKGKFGAAKTAAKNFTDEVLAGDYAKSVQIAVVSYSGLAKTDIAFSNDKDKIKEAIDKIPLNDGYTDNPGTNIQHGIHIAQQLLDKVSVKNELMIVLTDGEPNYAYKNHETWAEILDPYAPGTKVSKEEAETYNINRKDFPKLYKQSDFKYDKSPKSDNNVLPKTVSEAFFAKKAGTIIYAIGYEIGVNSKEEKVMKSVASKGK